MTFNSEKITRDVTAGRPELPPKLVPVESAVPKTRPQAAVETPKLERPSSYSRHKFFGEMPGASKPSNAVVHPFATYFIPDAVQVHFSWLQDDSAFSFLRDQELYTDVRKSRRLQARNGKSKDEWTEYGIPHFWAPQKRKFGASQKLPLKGETADREYDNTEHEKRIDILIDLMNRLSPERLVTLRMKQAPSATGSDEIGEDTAGFDITKAERFIWANTRDYHWRRGPKVELSDGVIVTPDIIGKVPKKHSSEESPTIFVEVVRTGFPSAKKWEAYKRATVEKPLIVAFDFVRQYGDETLYYFEPRKANSGKGNEVPDIRVIYYICQGYVWRNLKRLDVRSKEYPVRLFKSRVEKNHRLLANRKNEPT